MSEAPERIYARFATTGPGINIRKWSTSGFPEAEAEYLRADTAIPRAAFEQAVQEAAEAERGKPTPRERQLIEAFSRVDGEQAYRILPEIMPAIQEMYAAIRAPQETSE